MRELSDDALDQIVREAWGNGWMLPGEPQRMLVRAGYRAAQTEQTSGAGAYAGEVSPASVPLDHQNGVQRHEASAGCALGASSLESGNAREATCLNGEHDARRCSPTQQGQLGTNAGSIPAAPTDPITDLCARLRDYSPFERQHVVHDAADALERLARENAALRSANSSLASNAICHGDRANDLWTCPKAPCDYCLQWQTARAERAEAERDEARDGMARYMAHDYTETKRANNAEAERDVWKGKAEMRGREGCEARAERDALRECVLAADVMRAGYSVMWGERPTSTLDAYDAARAKVKP